MNLYKEHKVAIGQTGWLAAFATCMLFMLVAGYPTPNYNAFRFYFGHKYTKQHDNICLYKHINIRCHLSKIQPPINQDPIMMEKLVNKAR